MIVIVALDDRGGMMFNHRRQSMDKSLRERILNMTIGKKLWMNSYTEKQFSENSCRPQIKVSENFLLEAGPGEYCFVENTPLTNYIQKLEKIIVYRWNRVYPGDVKFDVPLDGWKLDSTTDFHGNSHEKITEEVYTR